MAELLENSDRVAQWQSDKVVEGKEKAQVEYCVNRRVDMLTYNIEAYAYLSGSFFFAPLLLCYFTTGKK